MGLTLCTWLALASIWPSSPAEPCRLESREAFLAYLAGAKGTLCAFLLEGQCDVMFSPPKSPLVFSEELPGSPSVAPLSQALFLSVVILCSLRSGGPT